MNPIFSFRIFASSSRDSRPRSSSSNSAVPDVGRCNAPMTCINVDLSDPDALVIATYSFWPIRTGVTVDRGTAYFAASMLPWKESYLCAVDATTGKPEGPGRFVEVLDGLTFEGAFAISRQFLFTPQGRLWGLVFDRSDGRRRADNRRPHAAVKNPLFVSGTLVCDVERHESAMRPRQACTARRESSTERDGKETRTDDQDGDRVAR